VKENFMKLLISAVCLSLLTFPAGAAMMAPISPHQALANRGQCVAIEGIASVRTDPQRPGIDVDLDGKDSPAFGYIEVQNKAQFPDLGSLAGQRVSVSGVVQFYRGRAEINLTSARQLTSATGDTSSGLTHIGPEFSRGDSSAICG
jgi:hypothetical protein